MKARPEGDEPPRRPGLDPRVGTTVPRSQSEARLPDGHVTLLMYQSDRVEAVKLAPGGTLVVGRGEETDVTIPDGSLSRQHARFRFENDGIWVDDMRSTNGTRVDGEKVRSSRLSEDNEVVLGDIAVTLHMNAPPESGLRALASERRFTEMVAAEMVRAQVFGREAAALRVALAPNDDTPLSRWYPTLRGCLRPVHQLGIWGTRGLQVLLPESNVADAHRLARSIVEQVGLDVRIGGVCMPSVLTSARDVLEEAGRAQMRASYRSPVELTQPGADVHEADPGPPSRDECMRALMRDVDRVAAVDVSVLVQGETGVGKEILARAIHFRSRRHERPLRCVNCGAIPIQLIESAFFGHERGAFTGAERRTKGIFEEADGGTVLLDEIGELPPTAQASLLRVLETKRVTRVGATEEVAVDVRVIATTHRDLERMSATGEFREDLWFRLNTVTLVVPPLRKRPGDILPLAERFSRQAAEVSGARLLTISPEVTRMLREYSWPGNVRELRNEMERAAVLASGDVLKPEDLSERLRAGLATPPPSSVAADALSEPVGDLKLQVKRYEAELIRRALSECDWNQTVAAERLNMPRRTLVHKIRQLGIRKPGGS